MVRRQLVLALVFSFLILVNFSAISAVQECPYESLAHRTGRFLGRVFDRKGHVEALRRAHEADPENVPVAEWFIDSVPPDTILKFELPPGKTLETATIPGMFFNTAAKDPNRVLFIDEMNGPITNQDIVAGVHLIGDYIQKVAKDQEVVGVLLPPAVRSSVAVLATQAAGKIPAMIDYTAGEANIASAIKTAKLKSILTSRAFVEKALKTFPELKKFEDRFVYLDDIRVNPKLTKDGVEIPVFQLKRLAAGLKSRVFSWKGLDAKVKDTAMILFTSGTSGNPKGVALTHENILTNISDFMENAPMRESDKLVAFLPAFHSFGANVTWAMPLVTGVKTVYTPSALDPGEIARVTQKYKGTVVLGTPKFLQFLAMKSRHGEMDTVRYVIHGAEKMPEKVAKLIRKVTPEDVALIEGYGLTETSPVIAANRGDKQREGSVGWFMKHLEWKLVKENAEGQYEEVPEGEEGVLLVRGPSVMKGYYNYEGNSPFVSVGGKEWFDTGDVVWVDPADQAVFIRGRAKLDYMKKGGQKIAFSETTGPLEAAFAQGGKNFIAVEDKRNAEKPQMVLFTTVSETKASDKEIAEALRAAGRTNLYIPDRIVRLAEFPQTGSGKVKMKDLMNMANQD